MAREFSAKFYKTSVWRDCRNAYSAYRGHLCEECIRRGKAVYGVEDEPSDEKEQKDIEAVKDIVEAEEDAKKEI